MSEILRLTLPYPPSANEYWVPARGGRGIVPSKEAITYKQRVVEQTWRHARPLFGDVVFSALIYRPRRAGDTGNRLKVLEDAIIGIAYLDDGQIAEYHRVKRLDTEPHDPRVEVELVGERFATHEEVEAARVARIARAQKARRTRNANRAAKRFSRAKPAVYR